MMLKIIGSGTCVPSIKRSSPANYIKTKNKQILVDCGAGTLIQLEKNGVSYKEIDIVCFSHYHTDHISDLNALIQALNWTPKFDRKKDLVLIGYPGFKKFFQTYIEPRGGKARPKTYKIIIKEIKGDLKFGNLAIFSYKTKHAPESIAYRFSEGGKSLVISGDTDFDPGLGEFSKNVDLLVLECAFANKDKEIGHLIPKECGEIAKIANPKKLVLTHIYPLSSGEKRLQETKKLFKNTILAQDGMNFKI
jgi:ribonuclease BN (tRNA processing enzyme)